MRLDRRDEGGSIIIAMSILLVVTGLAVAVLARTTSSMTSSRRSQDFNAALGQADAGVSDAIFRLDQLQGAPPSPFCVGAKAGCDQTPLPAAADVQYIVTPSATDPTEATIRSKGTSNSVRHGVEALAKATLKFPFAIFGKSSLQFNGASNDTITTVDANGDPSSLPAYAGSNGAVDCNPVGSQPADAHSAQGTSNCSPQQPFPQEYNPLDPVLDCSTADQTVSPPQPCPRDAAGNPVVNPPDCTTILGATVSGSVLNLPTSVIGGIYKCSLSVKFPESTFTISSKLELFIIPTSGSLNVDFYRSIVNGGAAPTADPTKLFIYMRGSGQISTGGGANAGEFAGVLYAPSATLTEDGCKAKWRGAIVVNSATCNGGPSQSIQYDTRVNSLTDGRWKVRYFKQIPSSQVVL